MGHFEVKVDSDVDKMSLSKGGYVHFCKDGKCTLLHRMVMGLKPGDKMTVDHMDRDKLNNVRDNLRVVTHQQNQYNRGLYSTNKNGLRGVEKRSNGRYQVRIGKKKTYLGSFATLEAACEAYNVAARDIFKHAKANVIT